MGSRDRQAGNSILRALIAYYLFQIYMSPAHQSATQKKSSEHSAAHSPPGTPEGLVGVPGPLHTLLQSRSAAIRTTTHPFYSTVSTALPHLPPARVLHTMMKSINLQSCWPRTHGHAPLDTATSPSAALLLGAERAELCHVVPSCMPGVILTSGSSGSMCLNKNLISDICM